MLLIGQAEIAQFLHSCGVDALWVQKDENCRYISGFTGSESFLFLTTAGSYLLTDSRYTAQGEKEAMGFQVIDYAGKLAAKAGELCRKHHVKKFGIEPVLSYKMYLALHEEIPDAEFIFCETDTLRQIKSEAEISCIAEACRIADVGFKNIIPLISEGRTEAELRCALECAMMEAGSEGKSFDTIVASGENGAYPHATVTDKAIAKGEMVTFDFGAIYKGYHSDITRTVAVGELDFRKRFLWQSVYDCVAHVEARLKEGMTGCEADRLARAFLKEKELDMYFGHALGHSVGLEIHETPVLAEREKTALQSGTVITVEPGVYIPGTGGVRIEDTTVIQKNGISILTKFPKELLCL